MKIKLDLDKFENIDSAFAQIKAGKNQTAALRTIERNLSSVFEGKKIKVMITKNTVKDRLFIMSVFPDQSTIDAVIDAIINNKSNDAIREAWNGSKTWTVEIDSRIIDDSIINVTSKELTALLLHEMGHVIYSNSIPQRISRVMRLEYTRAGVSVRKLLSDKMFSRILELPILNACIFDNFKTKGNIKKELKADVFVVKMGYADELDSVLTKLIALSDNTKIGEIDQSSQTVYNNMKSMTLFSINTAKNLQERKENVIKADYEKMLLSSPCATVQKSLTSVSDAIISTATNKHIQESVCMNSEFKRRFLEAKINKLNEELFTEFFDITTKKLKRINPMDIDYIMIQKSEIKTNTDKMILISNIYNKLDIINYYLTIIDSKNTNYAVPHSKEQLLKMRSDLEHAKEEIIAMKFMDDQYRLNIEFPEGYEG